MPGSSHGPRAQHRDLSRSRVFIGRNLPLALSAVALLSGCGAADDAASQATPASQSASQPTATRPNVQRTPQDPTGAAHPRISIAGSASAQEVCKRLPATVVESIVKDLPHPLVLHARTSHFQGETDRLCNYTSANAPDRELTSVTLATNVANFDEATKILPPNARESVSVAGLSGIYTPANGNGPSTLFLRLGAHEAIVVNPHESVLAAASGDADRELAKELARRFLAGT